MPDIRSLRRRLRSGLAAVRRHPVVLVVPAAFLAFVLGLALTAWWTCGFAGCPDTGSLSIYQPDGASLLLDRDGEPLAELAPLPSEVVDLDDLPSLVREAFIAVEDRRFREHHGVDWRRIAGATLANLEERGRAEGGSTITMQLARNMFPERIPASERTFRRKVLEMRVARAIEERFSKEEILELYLNNIYFGGGAHGIEAASRHYFGHGAERLSVPEMAMLAALPKAPSHYDPREHPDAARERRDLVLHLMVEQGRLGDQEAKAAADTGLGITASPPPLHDERPNAAPYFAEVVRRQLEERFGESIYSEPVRVWTTLDRDAQRAAEGALASRLRATERGSLGAFYGGDEPLQGAAVLLDATTGDVLAWVGGRDFESSQFDRVAHARRQPGSAFKPFVLAAALAAGRPLSTVLDDTPLTIELDGGRTWSPKNFGDQYDGRVTVRDALVHSKNVATVRLAQEVGTGDVARMAERMGIEPPIPDEPSMALGTVDVSPLELARAYGAFAGLGRRVEPRMILRVSRPDGEVLWESEPESEEVLAPAVAYLVDDVLSDVVSRGTGRGAHTGDPQGVLAGKTGTSDDNTDAWFAGVTPRHAGVVWIGFDEPSAIGPRATGGRLAAPVWGRMVAAAQHGEAASEWPRPDGVVEVRVDPVSGIPLPDDCILRGRRPVSELFLAAELPDARCPGRGAEEEERGPLASWLERREARQEARREAEARAEQERAEREKRAAERAAAEEGRSDERADEATVPEPASRSRRVRRSGLDGWWDLETRIRSSEIGRYVGLRLGFRVHLDQDGGRLTGHGEKISENGAPLAEGRRTPIDLEGSVDGSEVTLRFTERGARRESAGVLHLTLTPDGSTMTGGFRSGAASARGGARMLRSLR